MAQQNTQVEGYPDIIGGRTKMVPVDHQGPKSYTTGGETFPQQPSLGGGNSLGLSGLVWCSGGFTEDGLYMVVPVFGGGGSVRGTIKLKWFAASSAGGTFVGTPATLTGTVAAPTITTATNAGITTPVYTNGGALTQIAGAAGITGVQAPALTMNSYTPAGTITGSGGGWAEVSNGTNLSASVIRLLTLGG